MAFNPLLFKGLGSVIYIYIYIYSLFETKISSFGHKLFLSSKQVLGMISEGSSDTENLCNVFLKFSSAITEINCYK